MNWSTVALPRWNDWSTRTWRIAGWASAWLPRRGRTIPPARPSRRGERISDPGRWWARCVVWDRNRPPGTFSMCRLRRPQRRSPTCPQGRQRDREKRTHQDNHEEDRQGRDWNRTDCDGGCSRVVAGVLIAAARYPRTVHQRARRVGGDGRGHGNIGVTRRGGQRIPRGCRSASRRCRSSRSQRAQ